MSEGIYAQEARIAEAMVAAGERRWCDTCQGMKRVEDYHSEGHLERRGEIGYMVTDLECGHHRIGAEHVVGPAPGAPAADAVDNLRHRRPVQRSNDPWA